MRSTLAGWRERLVSGGRVNTVLQTCFFAISGALPPERGSRRSATAGTAVCVALLAGKDDIRRIWTMHNM
jgi:hypothetical protein